jgi:hypothetical protein
MRIGKAMLVAERNPRSDYDATRKKAESGKIAPKTIHIR